MIKDFAWHFFKKTGNIDAFLEYKNIEQIADNVQIDEKMGDVFGNSKDERNSNKSGEF